MGLVLADRTRDTSTTTGQGTFTVSGTAPNGYRTFSTVCEIGDIFPYFIAHQTSNEWEVGLATYTAANQFSRDVILSSSTGGSPDVVSLVAVNFSSGTKDVVLDVNAALYRGDQADNLFPWQYMGGF